MESCDTFVVMSDLTSSGDVIFGKNSDRPVGEVQEVVRMPEKNHEPNSNVQVSTYYKLHTFLFA
jgi:dipeptidase